MLLAFVRNQLCQGVGTGDFGLPSLQQLEHLQQHRFGPHLGANHAVDFLGHFLARLGIERPKTEIVQRQPAVSIGCRFGIIGCKIDLVRRVSQFVGDIRDICLVAWRGEEPLGGTKIPHGQDQTNTIGGTPQRGQKLLKAVRDMKKCFAFGGTEHRRGLEVMVFCCGEDLYTRHTPSKRESERRKGSFFSAIVYEGKQCV